MVCVPVLSKSNYYGSVFEVQKYMHTKARFLIYIYITSNSFRNVIVGGYCHIFAEGIDVVYHPCSLITD